LTTKSLLDNALDANTATRTSAFSHGDQNFCVQPRRPELLRSANTATRISALSHGGKSQIRVTDDGMCAPV